MRLKENENFRSLAQVFKKLTFDKCDSDEMLTDIRALLFELCEIRSLYDCEDLGVDLKNPVAKMEVEDGIFILKSKRRSGIVVREFKEAGVDIKTQHVSSTKPSEINVIGTLKGKEKEEMIICAHHDVVLGSVGADDNASGLLTLMTLAYFLKERYGNNPAKTVKLISFGGEEAYHRILRRRIGLSGSRRYVRYYDTRNTWGVMNLDLCGREEELTMVERDSFGTVIYDIGFAGKIRKIAYPLGIKIGNAVTADSCSDNRPFAEKGVRTVWLTRVNPRNKRWTIYHSCLDVPETINLDYVLENKELVENVIDYFMRR